MSIWLLTLKNSWLHNVSALLWLPWNMYYIVTIILLIHMGFHGPYNNHNELIEVVYVNHNIVLMQVCVYHEIYILSLDLMNYHLDLMNYQITCYGRSCFCRLPRLSLAVAHDYGCIRSMKWCPSGCAAKLKSTTDCSEVGLMLLI